jgi:hypothetical protein
MEVTQLFEVRTALGVKHAPTNIHIFPTNIHILPTNIHTFQTTSLVTLSAYDTERHCEG